MYDGGAVSMETVRNSKYGVCKKSCEAFFFNFI